MSHLARALLVGASLCLACLLTACSPSDSGTAVTKISIYRDGGVIVSGFRTDPTNLRIALDRARDKKATVWLYIEPGSGVGSAVASTVLHRLSSAGMTYVLFTGDDFNEYFGPDGKRMRRH